MNTDGSQYRTPVRKLDADVVMADAFLPRWPRLSCSITAKQTTSRSLTCWIRSASLFLMLTGVLLVDLGKFVIVPT